MTATITQLERRPRSWIELQHMDGRAISTTHSLHWSEKWGWITRSLIDETGCDYADIDLRDTDEGDIITVRGVDFAKVERVR